MRSIIIVSILATAACAVDPVTPSTDPTAEPVAAAPIVSPPSSPPARELPPIPTLPLDSPRFVEEGIEVRDTVTGAVWYGTDDAYRYEDSAAAACAALGYRVATSAEVEALGGPLPKAFHAVYAWTNTGFFPPSPRPIVTSDGCVDVLTASQYAGDCAIPGVPHISRSTMCIR